MRIHFIGICGVAMSALANAFHKKGHIVTGSDVGFYPPISTYLSDIGINYYPGWHPEKMIANGVPDLVIVGNVAGSTNPEWQYIQENKIPYKSYPEAIAEFLVRPNSIVCAGTFGKSTSTALLTWILQDCGFDPSYMFGGVSLSDIDAAAITDSSWSILEGDEYKSARWDMRPKFAHYKPTHLLLTAVIWDHADVYPTEASYIETFQKLVTAIPSTGKKVVSERIIPILGEIPDAVMYGKNPGVHYQYGNITQSKMGITFDIVHDGETYHINSPLLGEYMADNMTACFAMAREIGIAPEKIILAIEKFPNIKRRLEKRYDGDITVFDDIAHSPTKALSVLETLRTVYTNTIFAIFEPNTGNRKLAAAPGYDHAFADANTVIIPRLTTVKVDPTDPDQPFDGEVLAQIIKKTHQNTHYIDNDTALIDYLLQNAKNGDVIIFMGSHSFRNMIEELVEKLRKV